MLSPTHSFIHSFIHNMPAVCPLLAKNSHSSPGCWVPTDGASWTSGPREHDACHPRDPHVRMSVRLTERSSTGAQSSGSRGGGLGSHGRGAFVWGWHTLGWAALRPRRGSSDGVQGGEHPGWSACGAQGPWPPQAPQGRQQLGATSTPRVLPFVPAQSPERTALSPGRSARAPAIGGLWCPVLSRHRPSSRASEAAPRHSHALPLPPALPAAGPPGCPCHGSIACSHVFILNLPSHSARHQGDTGPNRRAVIQARAFEREWMRRRRLHAVGCGEPRAWGACAGAASPPCLVPRAFRGK